jgi:hypothetical protein
MTTEFGMTEDKDGQGTEGSHQSLEDNKNTDITPEDLEALRVRDAAAQAHIPDLESENKDLRDKVLELETNLSSATSLDDVMDKITNRGEGTSSDLDAGAVTQIVERALDQRQTETKQESNWTNVMDTLTQAYGTWKAADTKVLERAQELDIDISDATAMAKNNPKAFLSLFKPETTTSDSSAGVRSAGSGQQTVGTVQSTEKDKAYWKKMRQENPKHFWSLDGQAEYRRVMHPDTIT